MVRLYWKLYIALVLLLSSTVLGLIHIFVFKDAPTLFFYVALDIVFVPIQVLLVTIIIERFLTERDKRLALRKLNMVIGAFFGEAGNRLIVQMSKTCLDFSKLEEALAITPHWNAGEYRAAANLMESYQCRFDPEREHLEELKYFLLERRGFIIGLLQNPNLLEHEKFTDLLWAVCHLTEELEARADFGAIPQSDLAHLKGDIQRAFNLLVREWLAYMQHLKRWYPYMYSLSVRMNPFNPEASPLVVE